jgi:hypothetical protein
MVRFRGKLKNKQINKRRKLKMAKIKTLFHKGTAIALGAAVVVAAVVPAFVIGRADAALVANRKITISDSTGDATNVTYKVSFDLASDYASTTLKGIVIDFCANSPIIDDSTCTKNGNLAGFASGNPATIADFRVEGVAEAGWAGASLTTTSTTTVYLTKAAGSAANPSDTITFDVTGVHNPTASNTSFYARIYTYTDASEAIAYTAADTQTDVDFGGIALSTANQITITSKVQERINFCVYADIDGNDACGDNKHAIVLGDANGVLDPENAYVNNQARFDIGTNALGGAVVYMKGDTLESGGYSITSTDTGAVSNDNTEQFGMCLWQSTGSGLTVEAPYDDSVDCAAAPHGINAVEPAATFAFVTAQTTGVAGDHIATKEAGTTSVANLAFLGNIDYGTEAGIYSTNLTFIATGTF